MYGLAHTDASAASLLLLTLEGVATRAIAWFVFHENFDRRIALGMAFLVAGAAVLSWSGTPSWQETVGPLAIVAACIAWGIDNNLTRKVSLADRCGSFNGRDLSPAQQTSHWACWLAASCPGPARL